MGSTLKIDRPRQLARIEEAMDRSPVTALLGPRQCGKTWLVRELASGPGNYFDLYDYASRSLLAEHNFSALDRLTGTVVIDEAQLLPELFMKLRILADRPKQPARFVITGSASPYIVRGVSESLAGRVRLLPVSGFNCSEVGWENWERLWLRGSYPRSYLNAKSEASLDWRLDYVVQFVSKDLRGIADIKLSDEQLQRLLQMVANYHGQYWNHSQAAELVGVSYKTVQRILELFKGAFITRELPRFFTNSGKRLRKASKIYLRDSGLLHAMLMVRDYQQLLAHPILGVSWEGFCIEQIIALSEARSEDCFTWGLQSGAEIDLVLVRPSGTYGFEFKASGTPKRSRSMLRALADLPLKKLFVIYPGQRNFPIDEKIEAIGLPNLMDAIAQMA